MQVSSYINIAIDGRHFSMVEQKEKAQGALTTLSRIEEIMKERMNYAENVKDGFSGLPQEELYAALKQQAEVIRDGYVKKADGLSSFYRFFGRVSKKEKTIQSTFERIVNLAEPRPVLELPMGAIERIFENLQTSDLGKVAQVNRHGESFVKQAEIQRAQEYGYRGHDFAEAKNYLHNLFQSIATLAKSGQIPEQCVVQKGKKPFWRFVDSEATLKNIKKLAAESPEELNRALLGSVKKGYVEMTAVLLEYGANPNVLNVEKQTPLLLAKKNQELMELLLDHGADPNIADIYGISPLIYNIKDAAIIALLCENGADANYQSPSGNTPLHFAIQLGLLETAKVLLQNKADPDVRNNEGNTSLHLAKGNQELMQLLLDQGADPNKFDHNGLTPLMQNLDDLAITVLLCEKGADVNHQANLTRNSALHIAAGRNNLKIVEVLLQQGADPNLRNNEGRTPLFFSKWKTALIQLLLDHGADPNIADNIHGYTPLMYNTVNPVITALLCEKGADVNHQDNRDGNTALHFAAKFDEFETVKVLLHYGASPDILNNKGKTPYNLASRRMRKLFQ